MPILDSEIKFYLTGGSENSNPAASLGGAISSTEITSAALNNIFDRVTGDESAAGDTEYRCIACKNTDGAIDLEYAVAWISANTPSEDDTILIGVEVPSSGVVQTVGNESTAPTAISFSDPSSKAAGIAVAGEGASAGVLGAGHWVGIWLKRVVSAEASAKANNTFSIVVGGEFTE